MRLYHMFAIIFHEIRTYFKSLIVIILLFIPIISAFSIDFFLPASQERVYVFAINKNVEKSIIEEFKKYGEVEIYNSFEQINIRVSKDDDVIGIDIDSHIYLILEGNEPKFLENFTKLILKSITRENENFSNVKISDIGVKTSPLIYYLTAASIILSILFSGIILGLSLLRERVNNTISPILTSPVTKKQLLIGKSLPAFFLPVVYLSIILKIFSIENIDFVKLFLLLLSSCVSVLLIGIIIGFLSKSQIDAANIAIILLLLIFGIIFMVIFAPERFHGFLYWSPFYWSFSGIYNILNKGIEWRYLVKHIGINFILNVSYILMLKNKVIKGLK